MLMAHCLPDAAYGDTMQPAADQPIWLWITYRLRLPLALLFGLVLVSTLGYVIIESYGWVDALYMTVITLGTIGYGEVHELGTDGRLFTIGVIVASFATIVYAASVLTTMFTSGDLTRHINERSAKKVRDGLHDHVIVVGFGRVGHAVVRSLHGSGRQCVVLDLNEEHDEAIHALGAVHVHGDATDPDALHAAGIDRAAGLVAATDKDATNLVVVLTARAVAPKLRIVSRVNEPEWLQRIKHAGADVAQSPYESYGRHLAAYATGVETAET
jgi:voltage-gated potassium channel